MWLWLFQIDSIWLILNWLCITTCVKNSLWRNRALTTLMRLKYWISIFYFPTFQLMRWLGILRIMVGPFFNQNLANFTWSNCSLRLVRFHLYLFMIILCNILKQWSIFWFVFEFIQSIDIVQWIILSCLLSLERYSFFVGGLDWLPGCLFLEVWSKVLDRYLV